MGVKILKKFDFKGSKIVHVFFSYFLPLNLGGTKASTFLRRNVTIINKGTIVKILATRCDGIPECKDGIDEENCGFSTFETIFTGNPHII